MSRCQKQHGNARHGTARQRTRAQLHAPANTPRTDTHPHTHTPTPTPWPTPRDLTSPKQNSVKKHIRCPISCFPCLGLCQHSFCVNPLCPRTEMRTPQTGAWFPLKITPRKVPTQKQKGHSLQAKWFPFDFPAATSGASLETSRVGARCWWNVDRGKWGEANEVRSGCPACQKRVFSHWTLWGDIKRAGAAVLRRQAPKSSHCADRTCPCVSFLVDLANAIKLRFLP